MQPLEVNDFSGGMTENWLQGDPRRFQYADNYIITNDKKLRVRDPLMPIDTVNYILPSGNQRVSAMLTIINETVLVAQSGRKLFVKDPSIQTNWISVVGPSGNEPMQGGDLYTQTTLGEFQHQGYLTCDGDQADTGVVPTKIYRNSNNAWIAKTAGMPRSYAQNPWNNSTLLAAAIANANALRTSMISHMSDAITVTPQTYPNQSVYTFLANNALHYASDKYALSYLVAQTFVSYGGNNTAGDPYVPSPIPTPAPAATDLPSLLTLIQAMVNAMTYHFNDSLYGSANPPGNTSTAITVAAGGVLHINHPVSHMSITGSVIGGLGFSNYSFTMTRGPSIAPSTSGISIPDLRTACTVLDDMYQKWYWHQNAVNTHSVYNVPSAFQRYTLTNAKIGTVYWTQNANLTYSLATNLAPTISSDFSDVWNFANNCKFIYNTHVNNAGSFLGAHQQADNDLYFAGNRIQLADATSLDSAFLLTYWIRVLYAQHQADAAIATATYPFTNAFTALTAVTITANSTTASSITVGGSASTLPTGAWLTTYGNQLGGLANSSINVNGQGNSRSAYILSSSSGSAVLDRAALTTQTYTNSAQVTYSKYHLSQTVTVASGVTTDSPNTGGPVTATTEILGSGPSAAVTTQLLCIQLLTEFFSAFCAHITNQGVHFGAGDSPLSLTQATATPFFIPVVAQKAYAFYWGDSYTVEPNGIQYLVQGNPVVSASQTCVQPFPLTYTYVSAIPTYYNSALNPAVRVNTITNLPVLTNTSLTNYDTSNAQLWIFATTDGGNTFYLCGTVANGTTTYTDNNCDTVASNNQSALNQRQTIYTSGGVVGSDQPPQCKFIHTLNGTTYFGGIVDTGQWFPNRLRQGVTNVPDAAPASFYDDYPDEITGLSSSRSDLIVFCRKSIWRAGGGFTQQGQGALIHTGISDTLGCDNVKSIVRTEIGVFFAGFDGFYYTDGYQIIKISLELDRTYAALTSSAGQKRDIYGCYDKVNRRVYWAMKQNPTDAENSVVFVFYLNYGVKPSGAFTRILGNGQNFQPASMVFQNGTLFVGDGRGYVLFSDPTNKADALITVGTAAANWAVTPIPYYYASTAIDCGTAFKRKWITKAHIVGRNVGNASITPYVIRDANSDQKGIKPLANINYQDNKVWGTPIDVWCNATTPTTAVWNNLGKMDLWRRFPQTTLRSDFIQFVLEPASQANYASSNGYPTGANAVVNATAKTATIQTPSGYSSITWPLDVVGMTISFQTDGYVNQFPITALDGTSKIITYTDASNLSVTASGGVPWVIRGIKNNQKHELTSYVLHYALLGDKTQNYPGPNTSSGPGGGGENPS